jgi:outer membrane protein TolC
MKNILMAILLIGSINLWAQDYKKRFSLESAIEYALENNAQVKKAQNNVLKAQKKVWETTSMGFPQIDGNASYQKFIKQPVQLLPAQIMNPNAPQGTYVPVKFGTEQNMKWNATLKQLIFNGSYLVGLQSSRTYKKISENAAVKTQQKIREIVVNAYGNVLLTEENINILEKNIATVKQNLFEVEQMYKNGLVEETDVEQLQLTLANLNNQLDYMKRMKKTAVEMLNFSMGREIEAPLELADDIESLKDKGMNPNLLIENFDPEKNIDYQISKNQLNASKLQIKYEKSKALPSISAFVNYGKNAYNNDFKFFDNSQSWFEQSIFGLNINIPIFSSFGRSAKVQQAKIDFENSKIDLYEKKKELKMQYEKLKNEYEHAFKNYDIAKGNLALAEKIEKKEQIKFKEGIGNSFQLNQARMQLYQTQQQYLQSIINIINKKVALENLLGKN